MSDFTITRISSKPPRSWAFKDKTNGEQVPMETYNVMVEGENDPVEVNRKPGDIPAVGEVLTGTMETTEYGKRFKKARQPFAPKAGYTPKDTAEIKAMWAIRQAISFLAFVPETAALTDIEPLAKDLYAMVDRVKTGELSGFAKAAAVVEKIKSKQPIEDTFGDQVKSIDLNDIPF